MHVCVCRSMSASFLGVQYTIAKHKQHSVHTCVALWSLANQSRRRSKLGLGDTKGKYVMQL